MATLPTEGKATWTDGVDNWRKADGDWIQERLILRYPSSSRPTGPTAGTPIYNPTTDRLEYYSSAGRWVSVLAAEGLTAYPVTSPTVNDNVTLGHSSVEGQGLVFTPTKVVSTQPFHTNAGEVVLDSTGITVKTGTKTAKLTTDATSLVSDSPISAPSAILNSLSIADSLTLTGTPGLLTAKGAQINGNVSVTGTLGVTGATSLNAVTATTMTATGNIQGSRVICAASQDATINAATRKDYVDAQIATRLTQATADGRYTLSAGDTMTGMLTIDPASGDNCLRIAGTSPVMDFYNEAVSSRYGYIQGQTTALVLVSSTGLRLHATEDILFEPDAAVAGFMSNSVFVWGKAASDLDTAGVEMFGTSSAARGSIRSTTAASGIQNLYCRHQPGANGTGQMYAEFVALSTRGGSITQNGTSGVLFNQTSDMRLKNDLGLITDATERFMQLQPRVFSLKADPEGTEYEGFFAQELLDVIPQAVSGDPEGDPDTDPMGVDYSQTTPLTIATLQETIQSLWSLMERVAVLEAA